MCSSPQDGSVDSATEVLRQEHRELLLRVEEIRIAASEITELAVEERATVISRLLEFLRETLLPHAKWEEQVLYMLVSDLLGDRNATAAMAHDNIAITRMTEALADADRQDVARLPGASLRTARAD